jgi:hypothetical protein
MISRNSSVVVGSYLSKSDLETDSDHRGVKNSDGRIWPGVQGILVRCSSHQNFYVRKELVQIV